MIYRKSKTLKGDKVLHIARTKKGGPVIARAESEEELDKLLASRDGVKVEEVKSVEGDEDVVESEEESNETSSWTDKFKKQ